MCHLRIYHNKQNCGDFFLPLVIISKMFVIRVIFIIHDDITLREDFLVNKNFVRINTFHHIIDTEHTSSWMMMFFGSSLMKLPWDLHLKNNQKLWIRFWVRLLVAHLKYALVRITLKPSHQHISPLKIMNGKFCVEFLGANVKRVLCVSNLALSETIKGFAQSILNANESLLWCQHIVFCVYYNSIVLYSFAQFVADFWCDTISLEIYVFMATMCLCSQHIINCRSFLLWSFDVQCINTFFGLLSIHPTLYMVAA